MLAWHARRAFEASAETHDPVQCEEKHAGVDPFRAARHGELPLAMQLLATQHSHVSSGRAKELSGGEELPLLVEAAGRQEVPAVAPGDRLAGTRLRAAGWRKAVAHVSASSSRSVLTLRGRKTCTCIFTIRNLAA